MIDQEKIQQVAKRRVERWARNYSAYLADPVRRLEAAMRQQRAWERRKRMMALVRPLLAEIGVDWCQVCQRRCRPAVGF